MIISVIILAIIQGIAEFLQISSSAHLIIFRDLFSIGSSVITKDMALVFDIALHFGTLLAVILFFFKDFWNMFSKGITKGIKDREGKIFYYVIAATIPAAVVGVLFEDKIDSLVRNNFLLIGISLIFMGILLYLADKYRKQSKSLENMNILDAFIIGLSQVFALIPGFSRSGTTITCSRILNFDRTTSAKFSFFLSAPVILGAVILSLLKKNTLTIIMANLTVFLTGIIVSFIVGVICVKVLLSYIKKNDFQIFMFYRVLIGVIVILYTIMK